MNKQTFLLAFIRITAASSFLYVFRKSTQYSQLSYLIPFIVELAVILIFVINPELMWFNFKDADKKQSKTIFEIGLLLIVVLSVFTVLPKVFGGLYMDGSIDILKKPVRDNTLPAIQLVIYMLIIIRAKLVLPKLLKA